MLKVLLITVIIWLSATVETFGQLPEELKTYLTECEQARISKIFRKRERVAEAKKAAQSIETPETAEEQRTRDNHLKYVDAQTQELKELEDFDQTPHRLIDISRAPLGTAEVGRIHFDYATGRRLFIVAKVIDAKRVLVDTFQHFGEADPKKNSVQMVIEMPSKGLKEGDKVEPTGAWILSRQREKGQPDFILARPLDLRKYERQCAAIRKASFAEFQKQEKVWLKERERIEKAIEGKK